MRGLVKSIKDWHLQEPQRSLERWGKIRAKGKAAFVRQQMIVFPVFMTVIADFNSYTFDGTVPVIRLRSIIIYSIIGFFAGLAGWATRERKYLSAVRHRQFQTSWATRDLDQND